MNTVEKEKTGRFWNEARVAHLGTWLAFMTFFGAVYVMCASVAMGFDVLQALKINGVLVAAGLVVLCAARGCTLLRRARARMARETVPAWARPAVVVAETDVFYAPVRPVMPMPLAGAPA